MSIKQYDSRKAQISDEYKTTFSNLIKDPEFSSLLKKFGPKSEKVENFILNRFLKRENSLPIICFTVLDNGGTGLKWYKENKEKELKPFIDSFIYPVVGFLRRRMKEADPDFELKKLATSEHDALAAQAYYSVTTNDLIEQIGRRRSFPIVRQRGKDTATQMHDYIKIDGMERYAILIVWDESDINARSLKQTTDFLALNNPDFDFLQFKSRPQGFELINKNLRHLETESIKMAEDFAETAYFRGSFLSSRSDKHSIVAYPSKRYANTVIVGIADNFVLNQSIDRRIFIFALIVIIAIAIVMLAAYLSANLILNPITRLKKSIDEVAEGNLDTKISVSNKDELGQLAQEFTGMANGLKERKELASLISDHAIEALSQNQEIDGVLTSQAFSGIALVSDIRNFTGLCEKHNPDKITELLNEHFARMATIISKNGGRIYKFIGDAIEAVFPEENISSEENALRAFKAASLMNIELHRINHKRSQNDLFTYNFGVGLSIGKFYSGGVGSLDTRLDYAVVGEPLKYAADLESQSNKNPQFPIIVDQQLSDLLANQGITFAPIDDSTGYFIDEIKNKELIKDSEEDSSKEKGSVSRKENKQDSYDEQQPTLGKFSLISIFIFIVFTLAGIYSGFKFTTDAVLSSERIKLKEKNLRVIEQLKCEAVEKVGIETKCNHIIDRLEKQIDFVQKNNEKDLLTNELINSLKPLQQQGLPVKRIALLHFDNYKSKEYQNNPLNGNFIKAIHKKGWAPKQLETLKRFAHYKFNYDHDLKRIGLRNQLALEIPALLGNKHTVSTFYAETFGTAIDAAIEGNHEIFFCSYIYKLNDELKKLDFSQNVSQLKMPSRKELYRIAGMLIISVARELSSKPKIISELYATKDYAVALTDLQSKTSKSQNFTLKPEIDSNTFSSGFLNQPKIGVLNEEITRVANKTYRLSIFNKFNRNSLTSQKKYNLAIVLAFLIAIFIFFRTVAGNCFINRFLSVKLWLAFLICSIIPIFTVYFVVELFSSENLNA
ncbi:MAG: adenylate/guanylate cyclase domain-containing protein, partial [Candidatus Rifleibacteriota bacterium]